MNKQDLETMGEALASVARTPSLLPGFGIERRTVRADAWDERLAVLGTGKADLATVRSFGDASGDAIGHYATVLPAQQIHELVAATLTTLVDVPPPRLSPGDVRVLVTVVACGCRLDRVMGGLPPDLEPYQPLLQALDRAALATRRQARSVLGLGLELPASLPAGAQPVSAVLSFANPGSEGAWMRNPSAGGGDGEHEHVRLWYAERPVERIGVTSLPVEPGWVALEAEPRAQRPLLWLGAGEQEDRHFVASLALDPGTYLVRASFASYEGQDTLVGHPLLRGCVFSSEHTLEVLG